MPSTQYIKCTVYTYTYRVDMECQAFTLVVRIETPPPPHTQASVYPQFDSGGGGGGAHSIAGEGGVPVRTEDRHCGTLGIHVRCAYSQLLCISLNIQFMQCVWPSFQKKIDM
jgi:hypothetical protein